MNKLSSTNNLEKKGGRISFLAPERSFPLCCAFKSRYPTYSDDATKQISKNTNDCNRANAIPKTQRLTREREREKKRRKQKKKPEYQIE